MNKLWPDCNVPHTQLVKLAASCSARVQSVLQLWEPWAVQTRTRIPAVPWAPRRARHRPSLVADLSQATGSLILQRCTAPAALWRVCRRQQSAASERTDGAPATERRACASCWETVRRWLPCGLRTRPMISYGCRHSMCNHLLHYQMSLNLEILWQCTHNVACCRPVAVLETQMHVVAASAAAVTV